MHAGETVVPAAEPDRKFETRRRRPATVFGPEETVTSEDPRDRDSTSELKILAAGFAGRAFDEAHLS